jgi:hypothetical protein
LANWQEAIPVGFVIYQFHKQAHRRLNIQAKPEIDSKSRGNGLSLGQFKKK